MSRRAIVISVLLLVSAVASRSQSIDSLKDSWDKITIYDAYRGYRVFTYFYQIKRTGTELILTDENNTVLKRVEKTQIDKFFDALHSKAGYEIDPLVTFGRDSSWLIKNAKKLWLSYLGTQDQPAVVDSLATSTIRDYGKVKSIIKQMQSNRWTDDHTFVNVTVVRGNDSISIISSGKYPYMVPWRLKSNLIYNAEISEILSDIIPKFEKSSSDRLSGMKFENELIGQIDGAYVEKFARIIEARIKYPRKFSRISRQFEIRDLEWSDMGSSDWGGEIAAECLEMTLTAPDIPSNISFSVVLGRRIMLHSVTPITRKKKKILSQLRNNKVYQYAVNTKNTEGEIRFVNRKSLSRQGRRSFLEDVKDSGMKKSSFRGRFRHAILFSLKQTRGENDSNSGWIFLKDGTNILWDIRGSFLMNFDSEAVKKQGFVCRIISDQDFTK